MVFLNGFQKTVPVAKFSDFLFNWIELMKLPKSKAVATAAKSTVFSSESTILLHLQSKCGTSPESTLRRFRLAFISPSSDFLGTEVTHLQRVQVV